MVFPHKALQRCIRLLRLIQDPYVGCYVAMALGNNDQDEKSLLIMRKLYAQHPSNFMVKCLYARMYIYIDKLDEAKKIMPFFIGDLDTTRSYSLVEFGEFLLTAGLFYCRSRNPEKVQEVMAFFEQFGPQHSHYQILKEEYANIGGAH